MRVITEYHKTIALRVLSHAFRDNSGVLRVVKNDQHEAARVVELCRYCLTVSIEKQGAFITDDQKGVSLIYKSWKKQSFVNWLVGYFKLGQRCIGWDRALSIIKRDKAIKKRRPKEKHLYFWMLAVEDHTFGLNTIIEMRDFVFQYSKDEKLPIFAETTSEKTLTLYKRYGFKVYHQWQETAQGPILYFIRRQWDA